MRDVVMMVMAMVVVVVVVRWEVADAAIDVPNDAYVPKTSSPRPIGIYTAAQAAQSLSPCTASTPSSCAYAIAMQP